MLVNETKVISETDLIVTISVPSCPPDSCTSALTTSSHHTFISCVAPALVWHVCLGHPGSTVLNKIHSSNFTLCNKVDDTLCHACQLGKHVRLPFSSSVSLYKSPFDLIHCDVWTSPVISIFGFKYYLVLLDDFTHFCWTFPLK
jgi:hypothetical protein